LRDCGRLVGFEVAPLVGSDGVGCVSCGASCVSRLCDRCWCRCASSSEHGCLEWTLVSPLGRVCLFWHVRFGRAGNVRRWSILVDRLVASWVVLKSRVWYTFMCVSCARQRAPPASPYGRACDGLGVCSVSCGCFLSVRACVLRRMPGFVTCSLSACRCSTLGDLLSSDPTDVHSY